MKMQQIVKMLAITFAVLTISGCSQKLIMVPTECKIPDYSTISPDLVDRNTTLGDSKWCSIN